MFGILDQYFPRNGLIIGVDFKIVPDGALNENSESCHLVIEFTVIIGIEYSFDKNRQTFVKWFKAYKSSWLSEDITNNDGKESIIINLYLW